jgi:hypothetical protein
LCAWVAMGVLACDVTSLPTPPTNGPATHPLRSTSSHGGSDPVNRLDYDEKSSIFPKLGLLLAFYRILQHGFPRSSGIPERHHDLSSLAKFEKYKPLHSVSISKKSLSTMPILKTTALYLKCTRNCSNFKRFMNGLFENSLTGERVKSSRPKRGLSINHDLHILSKILENSRRQPPMICYFPTRRRLLKDIKGRIKSLHSSNQKSLAREDYKSHVKHKYNDYHQSKIANMLIKLGK